MRKFTAFRIAICAMKNALIAIAQQALANIFRARMAVNGEVAIASLFIVACSGSGDSSSAPPQATASTPPVAASFPSNGATLHYVLDLPAGPGPFPAIVVGHGAGAVTTSEGAAHVPFLLGAGFAVLRYDKRGVGQSTGTYRGLSGANSETQIDELAGDMAAGVAFLKTRSEIDPRRIGLVGVSQAGWVMVSAAKKSPDVTFFVAIVGPVLPVGTNTYYENLPTNAPLDQNYAALAQFTGNPGWDPLPMLRELNLPAIWLLGTDDRLVPTRECVRLLESLRLQGHRYRFVSYPGFGHNLSGSGTLYWPDVFAWMAEERIR